MRSELGTAQAALPLFVGRDARWSRGGNVTTFLVLWELMALTSLVLVLAEHRQRPEVGQAGVWYAAMTHAGLVAILRRPGALRGRRPAASRSPQLRAAAAGLSPGAPGRWCSCWPSLGFGSKAGMVPLHVWLPRAHPEAPSYVSALMSAAMVNLGLYGVFRVGFDLLGGGPRWWGCWCWSSVRCPRCTGCCRPAWPPISSGCWPTRPPRTWA